MKKEVILQIVWILLAPFLSLFISRNVSGLLTLYTDVLFLTCFISLIIAQWLAVLVWKWDEMRR